MPDSNAIANSTNIVIAGASVVAALAATYQARRASKSAESAKKSEEKITTLVANTQNFAPQIHVPITITNTGSTTGSTQVTAPSSPVVQRQIEVEPED